MSLKIKRVNLYWKSWSNLISFNWFSISIYINWLFDIVWTQFNHFCWDNWLGFQEFGSKFWLKYDTNMIIVDSNSQVHLIAQFILFVYQTLLKLEVEKIWITMLTIYPKRLIMLNTVESNRLNNLVYIGKIECGLAEGKN